MHAISRSSRSSLKYAHKHQLSLLLTTCPCLACFITTGGERDSDPCSICLVGTFSPGFSRDRCIPCGFGYTSPMGSKEERDCYPVDQCPAGTGVHETCRALGSYAQVAPQALMFEALSA